MGDTLAPGEELRVGDTLRSDNDRYRLDMQGDGNLVLYHGSTAIWDTGTWRVPAFVRPTRAAMQADDGHFVLYNDGYFPTWATGVYGPGLAGSRLTLQDDRNLVIYDVNNNPVWATNTVLDLQREIRHRERESVGGGKIMDTTATLYRNGLLAVDAYQDNNSYTRGLRGEILVVVIGQSGRAIWVSGVFRCPTRCSKLDPNCASSGRVNFSEQFPEAVGLNAERLNILQADEPSFDNFRPNIIGFIKDTKDLAAALKEVIDELN